MCHFHRSGRAPGVKVPNIVTTVAVALYVSGRAIQNAPQYLGARRILSSGATRRSGVQAPRPIPVFLPGATDSCQPIPVRLFPCFPKTIAVLIMHKRASAETR